MPNPTNSLDVAVSSPGGSGLTTPSISSEAVVEHELIAVGELNERQIAKVRAAQHRHGSNFAEAALSLGLIRRDHLFQALSKHYNYPILTPTGPSEGFSRELIVGFDAFGTQAESIRSTRAALVSSAIEAKTNSIAIIGSSSGVGVSFMAANLALSFAQAGVNTLLVDANLRRPRVGQIFGIDRGKEGLSEAINYRLTQTPPIVTDLVQNLSVLPSGLTPPNPQELLASPEFVETCNNLRRRFGIIIYDTTDTEKCVDGLIVASRVGAAVIVARRHKTAMAEVRKLSAQLRSQNCQLLGTVLDG